MLISSVMIAQSGRISWSELLTPGFIEALGSVSVTIEQSCTESPCVTCQGNAAGGSGVSFTASPVRQLVG